MLKARTTAAAAVFAAAGIHISWLHYNSTLFPYTIAQPTSYRHVVLTDALGRKSDFFFPDLGSYTTNVNVYAEPARSVRAQFMLHAQGAKTTSQKTPRAGWIRIDGKGMPLLRTEFRGIAGHWIVEQVTFTQQGRIWHLTASYDVKFRSMRTTMLRMLKSFKLRS